MNAPGIEKSLIKKIMKIIENVEITMSSKPVQCSQDKILFFIDFTCLYQPFPNWFTVGCSFSFTSISQTWLLLAIPTIPVLVQNPSNFSRNSLLICLTALISVWRASFTLLPVSCLKNLTAWTQLSWVQIWGKKREVRPRNKDYHGGVRWRWSKMINASLWSSWNTSSLLAKKVCNCFSESIHFLIHWEEKFSKNHSLF